MNQPTAFNNHNPQRVGISGVRVLDGEDLAADIRKKMQQLQQRDWIMQQIAEKEKKKALEREAERAYDDQTLFLNDELKRTQEQYEGKRFAMHKAMQEENLLKQTEKQDPFKPT